MISVPHTLISLGMASLEAEDVSGRTSAEIERVLYARVKDFGWLDRATGADRQEQWSVKVPKTEENAGSGSIRVRKSINLREPGAATQYILASKLDVGNMGASAETPEPSTQDQFNIFKYLANKGMLKDRYYFPIEATELNWEIDCFPKQGELYHAWVKIDLEKWPRGKELPQLPMEVLELIDGTEGVADEATKAKISELYETIFLLPNTKSPLVNYETTDTSADAGATDEEGQNKTNDQNGQGASGDDNPNANPDGEQNRDNQPEGEGDGSNKKPDDDPEANKDGSGGAGGDEGDGTGS